MTDRSAAAVPECVMSLSTDPPVNGNCAWRGRLIQWAQPKVIAHLRANPGSREFSLEHGLLAVTVRVRTGTFRPGATFRLQFEGPPPVVPVNGDSDIDRTLARTGLPCETLSRRAEHLVGLDRVINQSLLRLKCRWNDALPQWSRTTGFTVPVPLQEQLAGSAEVMIFAGDPGTGKTSAAGILADRYCRETGQSGVLLQMSTAEARGNGLVGDVGRRITTAFRAALNEANAGPVFLVIDEGDVLASSRSGERRHHEDNAATGGFIQALDSLAGSQVAVVITTNLPGTIDAAVRRRATESTFPRPDGETRAALLARWLPDADRSYIAAAVKATEQHTPADLNRALTSAYMQAISQNQPATRAFVLEVLRKTPPTRSV